MRISLPTSTLSRLRATQIRHSSTAAPLINIRNIPAPHCGSIRILSLHSPQNRNAISRALLADLTRHIAEIHSEGPRGPTRALIIASDVDEAFCAGADLKERRGFTREEYVFSCVYGLWIRPDGTINAMVETAGASDGLKNPLAIIASIPSFLTTLRSTLTSITTLPIPTITALSSLALGGGLELALTTNLRIFASSALVALPETRLGIIPGAGGTYRLPALVGPSRALDMLLTGRRVGGAEAYFWGLCERLVEVGDEEGMQKGVARARTLQGAVDVALGICEGGPAAVKAVLRAVGRGEEVENAEYEGVVGTRDRDEALRAFAEKRKPVFKGS
ncbi:hypothetical protein MMC27_001843 [Xylographa pallens]|nr:hypothetical protein [Xylographa pallens]